MLSLLAAALRLVYSAVLAAVLLNLFDAFRLLTGVQGAEGLGQQQRRPWRWRRSTPSTRASCSPWSCSASTC
jgi:hypothetical protein